MIIESRISNYHHAIHLNHIFRELQIRFQFQQSDSESKLPETLITCRKIFSLSGSHKKTEMTYFIAHTKRFKLHFFYFYIHVRFIVVSSTDETF